ncbi:MAG: alpha/beta hydrolase [Rhodocyclales bacterium]|nr:alpha/beta hydrolase [Rhodocyclales bacterium]
MSIDAGFSLNAITLGEPACPPILFVHGMAGSAGLWVLGYAFHLARNYRVIAYDQRGHGLSPTPPRGYRLNDQADDLEQVRLRLAPGPVTVVGYSYGGHIATRWAMRYPEHAAGLVVIDSPPLPLLTRDIDDLLDGLPALLGGDFTREGRFLDPLKTSLRDDILKRRRRILNTKSRIDALKATTFRSDVLSDTAFDNAEFKRIGCPTLLIYSTQAGHLDYAERQRTLIEDCELTLVDGGHDLVTADPDAVRHALERFMLQSVRPREMS